MRINFADGLRIVLGLKAFVILGFIVIKLDLVQFGEIVGFAQETVSEQEGNLKTKSDETKKPTILDELLQLTPLKRDTATREQIGRYLDIADRARNKVEGRLKLLNLRIQSLKNIEQSVEGKLKALDEEKKYIRKMIQDEKKIKEDRLEHLVALYEKMEPKRAAKVFESLDRDLVVGLINKIKRKRVTKSLMRQKNQPS